MAAALRARLSGGIRMILNGYGLHPHYQARSFCKVPPDDAKPAEDVKASLTEKKQEQTGDKPVTIQKVEESVSEEKVLTAEKHEEFVTEEKLQTAQKDYESRIEEKDDLPSHKIISDQVVEGHQSEQKQEITRMVEEPLTDDRYNQSDRLMTDKKVEVLTDEKQEQSLDNIVTAQKVEAIVTKEEAETVQKIDIPLTENRQDQSDKLVSTQQATEIPQDENQEPSVDRMVISQRAEGFVTKEEQKTDQKVEGFVSKEEQETLQKVESFVAKEEQQTVQKVESFVAKEEQQTVQKVESFVAKEEQQTLQKVESFVAKEEQETLQKESFVAKEEQETIQKVESVVAKEEQETLQKVESFVAKEEQQTVQKFDEFITIEEQEAVQKVEEFAAKKTQETLQKIEKVVAKEELETVQKIEGLAAKEEVEAGQRVEEVIAKEELGTVQKVESLVVKEEQETGQKVPVSLSEDRHDQSDKVVIAQKVEEVLTDVKHKESLDKMVTIQEVEGFVTEEQDSIQKADGIVTKMEEETVEKAEVFVAKERQETAQVKKAFAEEKQEVEDKKMAAQKKLHNLLTSLATTDPIPVEPVVKLSKPKARPKKRAKPDAEDITTTPPPEKSIEPELLSATKEVAESLGGDVEGTKSELLSALRLHSSDIANNDKPAISLSELFVGMKVERSQSKPIKEYPHQKRFDQELETRATRLGSDLQQQRVWSKTSSRPTPRTLARVDLFGAEPLGIFSAESIENNKDAVPAAPLLPVWEVALRREQQLCVTHPPDNGFNEMIQWTNQGKLWTFPIDNEFGLEEEKKIGFHEHVFLERHLEDWCPKRGPIRHFMELVCTGLSKNPYLTVQRKQAHIEWYKNYFAEKEDLLREIGAIESLKRI